MKKYLFLLLGLIILVVSDAVQSRGNYDKYVNAYPYYEKALKIASECEKNKSKNKEGYNKKMEEVTGLIKAGNERIIYYPPEGSILGMTDEEYERKSIKSEKICALSLDIIDGAVEIGKYLEERCEKAQSEDIGEVILEVREYIQFINRIIFSPNPPPLFIKMGISVGEWEVITKGLIPLFEKIGNSRESQILKKYERKLDIIFRKWQRELRELKKRIEKEKSLRRR